MKVELTCKTLGFPFGEIIEVGSKYEKTVIDKETGKKNVTTEEVTKKDLEALLKEDKAKKVNPKVVSDAKELQKRVKELEAEIASGGNGGGDSDAKVTELETANGELTAKVTELETANGELTTEVEELRNSEVAKLIEGINALDATANAGDMKKAIKELQDSLKAE